VAADRVDAGAVHHRTHAIATPLSARVVASGRTRQPAAASVEDHPSRWRKRRNGDRQDVPGVPNVGHNVTADPVAASTCSAVANMIANDGTAVAATDRGSPTTARRRPRQSANGAPTDRWPGHPAQRAHARVEDGIRTSKDSGFGRFPPGCSPSTPHGSNSPWSASTCSPGRRSSSSTANTNSPSRRSRATGSCTSPPARRATTT
jgi:hypothetical protein